jgi:hypothetical protein
MRDAVCGNPSGQSMLLQKWSLFVRNCLQADYLINERHLAPFGILQLIFLDLAADNSEVFQYQRSATLQERIGL